MKEPIAMTCCKGAGRNKNLKQGTEGKFLSPKHVEK